MASTFNAVCGALLALAFWGLVGVPVTRRLLPRALVLPFAPLAGWAMHSAVALPLFFLIPFSAPSIAAVAALAVATTWFGIRFIGGGERRGVAEAGRGQPVSASAASPDGAHRNPAVVDGSANEWGSQARVSRWAWAGAALLAMACAYAILPKQVGDAVVLSDQIFDHAKVAMVDEIARLGLPPGNPFFANDGGSGRLSYYYLLHFSAAELSRLLGVSGWEADIAMTFFAAFTSLAAMMALAVAFSGRTAASLWVVAFAASSSARVLLEWLMGPPDLSRWLVHPGGFGGWAFQSSWVPQHLISTSCVLLAVLLMHRVTIRPDRLAIGALGLVVAAAFESSTWVGGIVFAVVAMAVAPLMIAGTQPSARLRCVAALGAAGGLALLLVWPLLTDQLASSALRHDAFPIAIRGFRVLGAAIPDTLRSVLDLPAFWLVLLPITMPAVYLPAIVVLSKALVDRGVVAASTIPMQAMAVVATASLMVAWLLASTIADNNDLSWRAGLLGCTTLIVFAAVGMASWVAARKRVAVLSTLLLLALGLPEAALQIERNVAGHPRPEGSLFARTPELWKAVRAHTTADERIAGNPRAFANMTPWAVNIGWSLLANRRSCYAGWELTQVFTAVPHDRLWPIDQQFERVFAGQGGADDIRQLATDRDCAAVVVTPQDGAWRNDPFRTSAYYRLVDEVPGRWRIYRRNERDQASRP